MLTPSGNGYFLFTSLCCIGFESNDAHKMNERGQVAFFTNLIETEAACWTTRASSSTTTTSAS